MTDEAQPYSGRWALVADDDAGVRLIIRRFLEKRGFGVEAVADGAEALDSLSWHPFDLVVTDVKMPGMSGIEFLRQARERGLVAPVVFLTASGSVPDAVAAMKYGAFEFLEKPVRPDRLLEVVDAAMASSRAESRTMSIEVELAEPQSSAAPPPPPRARPPLAIGPMPPRGTLPPAGGRSIGRYEVIASIGRGGMGEVFRCKDPVLGRQVAVKVLQPGPSEPVHAAEMQARFRREAAAAGALNHPGIVGVHDFGVDDASGCAFIVLELVAGRGLESVLAARGRLPAAESVSVGYQVADALGYAHAHGVVHRDIKPSNVLLQADGAAKLVDFGLAAVEGWEVTSTGRVFGSPSYMAPERIRGVAGGPPADQFSLGVLIYEALAGGNPFAAPTPEARLMRILNEEPQPIEMVLPDAPPDLSGILQRMMSKEPAARFPSSVEVAAEFLRVGGALGVSSSRSLPPAF
jgi:CheY-like chemotaxis protein